MGRSVGIQVWRGLRFPDGYLPLEDYEDDEDFEFQLKLANDRIEWGGLITEADGADSVGIGVILFFKTWGDECYTVDELKAEIEKKTLKIIEIDALLIPRLRKYGFEVNENDYGTWICAIYG